MLTKPGFLVTFGFPNVGAVAGTAREFVDETRFKILWDLVLKAEQRTKTNSCFRDQSHFCSRKVLFEDFPDGMFGLLCQCTKIREEQIKVLFIFNCCINLFADNDALQEAFDNPINEAVWISILPHY